MRIVIFGLSVSSSWGNGHAALWRGLIAALHEQGHAVTFVERDLPFYAAHRDLHALPGGTLVLHDGWDEDRMRALLRGADAALVTSFCPDAAAATALVLEGAVPVRAFHDLDTPHTLARLEAGERVEYLPPDLGAFDLVLSYGGGPALAALERLGARRAVPLYGSVDPAAYHPAAPRPEYRCDLSYLGTYAADRQPVLDRLFLQPARRRPELGFVLGGAQYPADFPWGANTRFVGHVPPAEHPAFHGSARLVLNVTRAAMAATGWCPSGRLFEAAACAAPVLTDPWPGLEHFFAPGTEILVAGTTEDALDALSLSDVELRRIGDAARARALSAHSAAARARELVAALEGARASRQAPASRPVPLSAAGGA